MAKVTHRKIIGPYLVTVRDGKTIIQQGKPFDKGVVEGLDEEELKDMLNYLAKIMLDQMDIESIENV